MEAHSGSLSPYTILGAGPAGLACALELGRQGHASQVYEKQSAVGGLCRTLNYKGYLFDIGGHRFLSKSLEVNALWRETLQNELLQVERRSRILFKDTFFDYPLSPTNALKGLGWWEAGLCVLSYAGAKFAKVDESSFEGWMIKRFGRRLYEIFFKTYTEKVWAIPCSQLSSQWAVQRIHGLSLAKALARAFGRNGQAPKSLAESFFYPKFGPGQFCEALKKSAQSLGASFQINTRVKRVCLSDNRVQALTLQSPEGDFEQPVRHMFSTIPLTHLMEAMTPEVPPQVRASCQNLKYRSFIAVNLIIDEPNLFPDNWLYIHTPAVRAGRIQNYKNWSSCMVPDVSKTSLGVEYFVTEGDHLWNLSDRDMLNFALDELVKLKLIQRSQYVDGCVVRVPNAYPVYGPDYQDSLAVIRQFLETIPNLQVIGRAGLFRYDNSDHALLCGLYAARNLNGSQYDLWNVNTEKMHHEEYESTEIY